MFYNPVVGSVLVGSPKEREKRILTSYKFEKVWADFCRHNDAGEFVPGLKDTLLRVKAISADLFQAGVFEAINGVTCAFATVVEPGKVRLGPNEMSVPGMRMWGVRREVPLPRCLPLPRRLDDVAALVRTKLITWTGLAAVTMCPMICVRQDEKEVALVGTDSEGLRPRIGLGMLESMFRIYGLGGDTSGQRNQIRFSYDLMGASREMFGGGCMRPADVLGIFPMKNGLMFEIGFNVSNESEDEPSLAMTIIRKAELLASPHLRN